MLMTDSHCHFDFDDFESDRAQHWQRAQSVGVNRLVIPGIEETQWPALPRLCADYHGLYYALGLHPWWLARASTGWQKKLAEALSQADERCVAVGEFGLDRSLTLAPEVQETALIAQLKLAMDYQLPVILHSQGTHDKILKWLRRYPVGRGVVHGFAGSLQQAESFWKLGLHIGVGGTITYPRANKTRQAIAALPVAALVLETDAPDMPLCGFQGQPNHPAQLPRVLSALAELRQQDEGVLATLLENNVNQLFGWSFVKGGR